jgi:hypothetical protein
MRFAQTAGQPIHGVIGLNLANGPSDAAPAINLAYWFLASEYQPVSGLIRAVGPAGYERIYSAFVVDGEGTVTVRGLINCAAVFHGTAGEHRTFVSSILLKNGVELTRVSLEGDFTGSLKSIHGPGALMSWTGPCVAGDRFEAALILHWTPLIFAFSAGAGQAVFFDIVGDLTQSDDAPQVSMRGSGVVGGSQ